MIVFVVGLLLLFGFAGCGSSEEGAGTDAETAGGAITLNINTEGMGQIAYAKAGESLAFDDEFPVQSAQENLSEPADYVLSAKADEGWKFVKWTKDGEDLSTDAEITVTIDASAEYVAVFDIDE